MEEDKRDADTEVQAGTDRNGAETDRGGCMRRSPVDSTTNSPVADLPPFIYWTQEPQPAS